MGDSAEAGRPARGLILTLAAVQLAAFWPVWKWCAIRAAETPEGPWCLVPLGVLVVLIVKQRPRGDLDGSSLTIPSVLTLLYAGIFHFVPPLIRAIIAMLAIASTLSRLYRNRRLDFGIAGLLLVALPVVTTLQVYAGYHLRLLATELTAPLLRLSGFSVVAEGTALNWAGQPILVDAPCSGIKMLWAGFFLTFSLASALRLGNARCVAAALATLVAVVVGNVLRAAGLFFLEARVIEGPAWAHDALGGVAFLLTALFLFALVHVVGRVNRCVPSTSPAAS